MPFAFASTVDRSTDLPDGRALRFRVQPLFKKYSVFPKTQISLYPQSSCSTEGRFANVTNAGRDAVDADGACDESVCRRTAKSCGPDASTPASSLQIFRKRRWQESRSPGRARYKP